MPERNKPFHPLEQSCLFRVPNPDKLAKILLTSRSSLEALADTSKRYNCWTEPKKNGGVRHIEAPHDNLKATQKRIAQLLQRIEPPPYLMAPVKGRSYVHNAAAHLGGRAFTQLDIQDFFPSCKAAKVYWFFSCVMMCPRDVATILTKVTTFNRHLPQGSPSSPILAYFAYKDMWDAIDRVASKSGCVLTIYADDITISGKIVYQKDIWEIKRIVRKHGHALCTEKERTIVLKPADVTGVIVAGGDLLLPNRQHRKLAETKAELVGARTTQERAFAARKLRGRKAQASQILDHLHKG